VFHCFPVTIVGTTVTLGDSGDTFTIPSGATITNNGTQTGFGRTGTVDWDTTPKTATFTAVSGEGYFCDTSSGAFTVNFPAGSAGAIVSVSDYTRTFQTNNLTISPNGSEKIGGIAADATLSTEGQTATFVYVDGTEGWINIQETSNSVTGRAVTNFIIATGGTETTSGDYKIHTFTAPGTFTVTNEGTSCGSTRLDYMVIAGGGAGGHGGTPGGNGTGGGGAGGFRESVPSPAAWTASPLATTTGLTAAFQAYPITVGAGASYVPGSQPSTVPGSASIFSTITSAGGGSGGGSGPAGDGGNGGSGGGGTGGTGASQTGGSGNTPPRS
jgi:hypothetical protein